MKLLILGSGLMGPAAAFNALSDPKVTAVTLADMDASQLDAASAKLSALPGGEKLRTVVLDLNDGPAARELMAGHDAIVAALPSAVLSLGVRAAIAVGTPWIDLSSAPATELPELQRLAAEAGVLVIPGCGVEPGLTEIMARHLGEKLDEVSELHIKCGGIPEAPTGPLNYKIVFGGKRMPLRDYPARIAEQGKLVDVPRYSGVETFTVEGVGEVEAWHEGFMPWLLELDIFKEIGLGTQKTVRWPGYADKVTVLRELGLLSLEPVDVNGTPVLPKAVVDAVLYPAVKLEPHERDLTIFRVEVSGWRKGQPRHYCVDMLDRYDEELGFTSMARVTAFTGAIVARMVAAGELSGAGWQTPEKLITGELFDRLVEELGDAGVTFTMTKEKTKPLA